MNESLRLSFNPATQAWSQQAEQQPGNPPTIADSGGGVRGNLQQPGCPPSITNPGGGGRGSFRVCSPSPGGTDDDSSPYKKRVTAMNTTTTTTRHSPRRSHSRAKLPAAAPSNTEVLCLTLPRRRDDDDDDDGSNDAAPGSGNGGSQHATIRVQVYCSCTAAELHRCRIEAIVRGRRIPVSLCSDAGMTGSHAADAEPSTPTLRLGPAAATGGEEEGLEEEAAAPEKAAEARGPPLALLVDLKRCGGPGQLRIELRSAASSTMGGGRLLASGAGLLLPSSSKAAAREIMRFHRSWSAAMLDDLAAMLECADAIHSSVDTVWDRRQHQQRQRHVDWEARGDAFSSSSYSSASSASPAAVTHRPRPIALRRMDKDYVGLLVWSGQNLVCGAEERGWRATEKMLDGVLQVLETSLKGLLPPVGALRPPYVATDPPCPNLDGSGGLKAAGAGTALLPESIRLAYSSRDNRTVTFQIDNSGVRRPVTATRSFIKPPSWQAGLGGAVTAVEDSILGLKGKLEFAAAVVCMAVASALHGGFFLGQGLASVLPAHALIAGPYAALLLLLLFLPLLMPPAATAAAAVGSSSRRGGCDPAAAMQQRRRRAKLLRTLATASHVAAMLSLRAAQLLMLQGHIAVPLAMAESIRLALDWPAQVMLVYIEGPWSLPGLALKLLVDVPLQYAFLLYVGELRAALPRAVMSQLLAVAVYWFAFRGLRVTRAGETNEER